MSVDLPLPSGVIRDADVLVARYVGLTGEVWAYPFYDLIPREETAPSRTDLLAAGVLHGPLNRRHLEWFEASRGAMTDLLDELPDGIDLDHAPPEVLEALVAGVTTLGTDGPASVALASKVLHRHRPRLVPIADKTIDRRYAPGRGRGTYEQLVTGLAADLADPDVRSAVEQIGRRLSRGELATVPAPLRIVDIAIWMDGVPISSAG